MMMPNNEDKSFFLKSKKTNITEKLFSNYDQWIDFLDHACDSFVFVNSSGKVVYANKRVKNMFGYNPEDLIGSYFQILIPSVYRSKYRKLFKGYLENPHTRKMDNLLKLNALKQDNSEIPVNISLNPMEIDGQTIICCIIRDATEELFLQNKLIAEKNGALELAQSKADFLAQMSHEIRSPINIIMNFSGLVREVLDTQTQDSLKEEFAIISNAGKRIIRTVDLVLNISEIQSGKFEIEKTTFNIYDEILSRIFIEFRHMAKEKNIKFFLKSEITDGFVHADEYCVFQTLMNLVDNALKYTYKGKIEIKLSRSKRGQIIVVVSDTGIGMSEKYQEDLFKPFHQEEHGLSKRYLGNGLGLALVKKYCDLNDIEIKVNSKKDVGTKFKLSFLPPN